MADTATPATGTPTVAATLGTWTEQHETTSRWYDCGWSSALTALVYAGFTQFPEGIYTLAERDALVSGSAKEPGGDSTIAEVVASIKSRYGIVMTTISKQTDVYTALNTPGKALIVQGESSFLPTSLQNGFQGAHTLAVIPLGNGKVAEFDPLLPMNSAPTIVSTDVIKSFFDGLSGAQAASIPLAPALAQTVGGGMTTGSGGGIDITNPSWWTSGAGGVIGKVAGAVGVSVGTITGTIGGPNPVGGLDGIAQGVQAVGNALGSLEKVVEFFLDPQNWLSMIVLAGSAFLVIAGGAIVLKSAAQ